jgi:rare lipoprotein A
LTAAHKTLKFGTKVKVTNLHNGKSVFVTITDRGPFVRGRVIDLSNAAKSVIDMKGVAKVSLEVIK